MVVSRVSILAFTTLALFSFSVVDLATAQSRGGATVPVGGATGAAVVHAVPAAHVMAAPPARTPMRSINTPSSTVRVAAQPRLPGTIGRGRTNQRVNVFPADFTDFQDVPGLGFDFPHLAAINASRPHHGRRFVGNVPFFDGFLLTSPSVIIEQPAPVEEQPQMEDADASNVLDEQRVVVRRHKTVRQPEVEAGVAPASEPSTHRDMEQFVFVQRDGSLVFAVAYTWIDNTLRYITPEGLRRTIDRDALDLNATQQFNEQRGVSFRAPA